MVLGIELSYYRQYNILLDQRGQLSRFKFMGDSADFCTSLIFFLYRYFKEMVRKFLIEFSCPYRVVTGIDRRTVIITTTISCMILENIQGMLLHAKSCRILISNSGT
jgi:hypothetical protein